MCEIFLFKYNCLKKIKVNKYFLYFSGNNDDIIILNLIKNVAQFIIFSQFLIVS